MSRARQAFSLMALSRGIRKISILKKVSKIWWSVQGQ
jgi:hypothetical protein